MKINLLKNRRVLSEKDYLQEKKFLQISISSLIIVVIVTTAMAIWNYALTVKLSNVEAMITSANKSLAGLAQANVEQVYVKNRLNLIGGFLDEQSIARESLQQVLTLSIPGVSIGGINFESQSEIQVNVIADNAKSLADVVTYYEQSDNYFPQVISLGVTRNKDTTYELKLILTLPIGGVKS